ncbi:MAG TPA: hypothetical protein PLT97_01305 [Smithellaceae bacterium]|nr:hypothetical protein [Smithellaceae bacterium]
MHGNVVKLLFFACFCFVLSCSTLQIQKFSTDVTSSSADTEALFFDAAAGGNIFLVMRLVEENMVDVNVRDHYGWKL